MLQLAQHPLDQFVDQYWQHLGRFGIRRAKAGVSQIGVEHGQHSGAAGGQDQRRRAIAIAGQDVLGQTIVQAPRRQTAGEAKHGQDSIDAVTINTERRLIAAHVREKQIAPRIAGRRWHELDRHLQSRAERDGQLPQVDRVDGVGGYIEQSSAAAQQARQGANRFGRKLAGMIQHDSSAASDDSASV